MENQKAAFWVYFNGGWQYLKLEKGKVKTLLHCQTIEEGWEAHTSTYAFEGEGIELECVRRTHSIRNGVKVSVDNYYAPLDKLAVEDCKDDDDDPIPGIKRPLWEHRKFHPRAGIPDHGTESGNQPNSVQP